MYLRASSTTWERSNTHSHSVLSCNPLRSDKALIGQHFPSLLVNGSLSDEAYANFLQFRDDTEDLGLRKCDLESIMNEVRES